MAEVPNDLEELGSSGLLEWNGFVHEEFLQELAGTKRNEVFREMSDNDPVVGAILFVIEMLIR